MIGARPLRGTLFSFTILTLFLLAGCRSDSTGLQGNAAPARVFTDSGPTALAHAHPTPDPNLDPRVSGLTDAKHVYGSVRILHAPSTPDECGGHGHLHGTQCHCDSGYQQDPDDPGMCIAA